MKKVVLIILMLFAFSIYHIHAEEMSDEELLESFLQGALYQIDLIEDAWERVNERVLLLEDRNEDLIQLLEDAQVMIVELRRRLASAEQGVEDSIENWWHMETLLEQARNEANTINQYVTGLERQLRVRNISFRISVGIGMGAGGYMLADGLLNDRQTTMYAGAGVLGINGVLLLGHLIGWW